MDNHLPQSKKYHRIKLIFLFLDISVNLGVLIFLQGSGMSSYLNGQALLWSGARWLQILFYLICFFNLFYFVSLPLQFISGFLVERKFGLSDQKLRSWLWDEVKKYLLSFVFFIVTMELLYFTFEKFPQTWWVIASIGWLFLTLFLTRILPTVLLPLFYRTKTLPGGELKERLLQLCARCHVRVMGIYELALSKKTKKANAALVGLGKSRRILLGDTLLNNYVPSEVEMVVAHELGHQVKRHITKAFCFQFLSTFIGFYLLYLFSRVLVRFFGGESLADLSLFPVLALLSFLAGLFMLPLQNGFSRYQENEADRFALEIFPSKDVFTSLMNKLGEQNLADVSPNPWVEFFLYDHPSISNRIKYASKVLEGRRA